MTIISMTVLSMTIFSRKEHSMRVIQIEYYSNTISFNITRQICERRVNYLADAFRLRYSLLTHVPVLRDISVLSALIRFVSPCHRVLSTFVLECTLHNVALCGEADLRSSIILRLSSLRWEEKLRDLH